MRRGDRLVADTNWDHVRPNHTFNSSDQSSEVSYSKANWQMSSSLDAAAFIPAIDRLPEFPRNVSIVTDLANNYSSVITANYLFISSLLLQISALNNASLTILIRY